MPTSRTRPAATPSHAGFTLIELLAVLAILALAVTVFGFGSSANLRTANFRALLVKTSAEIKQGRADAIRQSRERVFLVDIGRRRMGYEDRGMNLELPPDIGLTATVAESERYENGILGIRFHPGGTSSGGVLAFTNKEQVYEIRVNWLTGNVSLHRS